MDATLASTVLEARDPVALAAFYRELLGMRTQEEHPEWVVLRPPGGGAGLSFQRDPGWEAPAWPARDGSLRMQAHLDVAVGDLAAALARAQALGARAEDHQPQDDVRVLRDPEGHLFCLYLPG